jgi:hypothetical protein
MSGPGRHFRIEDLLCRVGRPPCRNRRIDRGNDDLALRDENARVIAAIPDTDIAAAGRFRNGNDDTENLNSKIIEMFAARSRVRRQLQINACSGPIPRRNASPKICAS